MGEYQVSNFNILSLSPLYVYLIKQVMFSLIYLDYAQKEAGQACWAGVVPFGKF